MSEAEESVPDEPLDTLWRVQCERDPHHSSQRDPAERDPLEPQLVKEPEQAVREPLDRRDLSGRPA